MDRTFTQGRDLRRGRPSPHVQALIRAICSVGILAALAQDAARSESPQYDEHKVKGAFLARFATFVEWPDKAFADARTPIIIGVIGKDPFGSEYEAAMSCEKAHGRAFLVKRLERTSESRSCQILFVSSSESQRLPEILATLGNAPVLVVGDQEGFAQRGGMINFFKEGGMLRFEINEVAVKRSGLAVHSKLLSVARIVKTDPARLGA